MTRYFVLGPLILAGGLFASTLVIAQEPAQHKSHALVVASGRQTGEEDSAVFDDDGGRVFIITRGQTRDISSLRFHGGEIISQPRQVSIFLGADWSDPQTRSREARLSGVLAGLDNSTEGAELGKRGVTRIEPSQIQYEQPWQFEQESGGDQAVSDLQIQRVLSSLVDDRRIVSPDSDTIYTVFLSPELKSTLGALLGRKHYLAYHNFFHIEGAQIRYVVVPFEPNKKVSRSVVTQALIQAILNPTGNGWY